MTSPESAIQCAAYTGKAGRCPNMGLREHEELVDADGTGRMVWLSWCDFHHRFARNAEIQTLQRRTEYLTHEINLMRKVMQYAGTWDQFCADYAAYKRYREESQSV